MAVLGRMPHWWCAMSCSWTGMCVPSSPPVSLTSPSCAVIVDTGVGSVVTHGWLVCGVLYSVLAGGQGGVVLSVFSYCVPCSVQGASYVVCCVLWGWLYGVPCGSIPPSTPQSAAQYTALQHSRGKPTVHHPACNTSDRTADIFTSGHRDTTELHLHDTQHPTQHNTIVSQHSSLA